ncbi:hypothetical protein RhoFW510R10_03575 [Rhodanobacter sp. FW510-R10]|nr:hypothetical protein RhoFW510R10_03575 [Rhodanobacter sp. FW510-R10]
MGNRDRAWRQSHCVQRGQARLGRRIEKGHPARLLAPRQRAGEQLQLTDAGAGQLQLHQRTARPAATGQHGIEERKTAGHRAAWLSGYLARAANAGGA